jgi:hypothetical protein
LLDSPRTTMMPPMKPTDMETPAEATRYVAKPCVTATTFLIYLGSAATRSNRYLRQIYWTTTEIHLA